MGAIDIPFLFDLESRLKVIQEDEYSRMMSSENQWWEPFTKVQTSGSRKELFFWILSTATIEPQGKGGNVEFDDMVILESDYTNLDAGKGMKIRKQQLQDLDGNGVQVAESWVRQISAQAAYWPQKQVSKLILAGESGLAYDGRPYFDTEHPYNPFDEGIGSYANLFTSTASGAYPGALPIHDHGSGSVDLETAFANVGKAIAYIKSLRMPNGKDPRFLVPRYLLVPPTLQNRAIQLTNAKFIAQVAGSGAGSADVEAVIKRWGLNTPVIAPEFSSIGTGEETDDTSWYIGCEQMTSSQLGALLYVDREPFRITYYTGEGGGTGVDAILDRAQELEWHTHGRNVAGYGHPYALFKVKAA
jgi:phage major head subunit gpT-like protein